MSLILDIKNDIQQAKAIRIPFRGVLYWMIICTLIELSLLGLGRFDLGLPTLNSIAVIGFTVALKRKQLGHHVWFWVTMSIVAVLHVPLVLFIPWTSRWVPAIAIAALDSVDFILMLAIIAVIGKLAERPK